MIEELSAEDLLARVAQYDVAALGELYDRYAPRMYGLMTHILSPHDGAEDILQEVFLRLWNESASLSHEGASVVAWLVVTSRGAAVDRLRALGKNAPGTGPRNPGDVAAKRSEGGARKCKAGAAAPSTAKSLAAKAEAVKSFPADAGKSPARVSVPLAWLPLPKEITLIDERLGLLHKAINQLPASQWQALELAVFGGLNESEIAEQMGEPLGKVRRVLRAAVTFITLRRRAVMGIWAANI
jgi:RNA polymerase sigma factor (sigma-70 family)